MTPYRTMTLTITRSITMETMPLAEDVVLKDSSADPQAEAVETTGADAVAAIADPDNWTVYNTTLVVQGGKVEMRRRGAVTLPGKARFLWKPLTNASGML